MRKNKKNFRVNRKSRRLMSVGYVLCLSVLHDNKHVKHTRKIIQKIYLIKRNEQTELKKITKIVSMVVCLGCKQKITPKNARFVFDRKLFCPK